MSEVFKDKGKIFRDNVVKKMFHNINDSTVAINLEKAIFNYSLKEAKRRKILKKWENKKFQCIYLDRLRSIYINLKNPNLLKQLNDNELTPQYAFMTHQEMNPLRWKTLIGNENEKR